VAPGEDLPLDFGDRSVDFGCEPFKLTLEDLCLPFFGGKVSPPPFSGTPREGFLPFPLTCGLSDVTPVGVVRDGGRLLVFAIPLLEALEGFSFGFFAEGTTSGSSESSSKACELL